MAALPFDASDALPPSPRAAKVAALRAATHAPAVPTAVDAALERASLWVER